MNSPLAALTLVFCFGIFAAKLIRVPFSLLLSFLAFSLLLSFINFKKEKVFLLFLALSVFILGATLFQNALKLPACHINKYVYYSHKTPYLVKGLIINNPEARNNRQRFLMLAEEVQFGEQHYRCCGKLLVSLKSSKEFFYGDRVLLYGRLYRPFGSAQAGGKSYREYLRSQGILLLMNVKNDAGAVKLKQNQGWVIKKFAYWLKNKMQKVIDENTSSLAAGILEAMVLGEKGNIPPPVYDSMVKSGTVHILVVSGFNVGIVSFITLLFLKLIRIARRSRFIIAIMVLIIYCFATGASNPVVRATIMGIFFLGGALFKREPQIANSLSIAALIILGINPCQLFDTGFQLSFVSVVAIVYLYPRANSFLKIDSLDKRLFRFLAQACLVSFCAWVATSGLIASNFRIISCVAVLANLFIVPLATLITLSGFSLVVSSLALPVLTPVFAAASELLVVLLIQASRLLIKLPGAYLYLP